MAATLFEKLQQFLQPILIAYIVWRYYKKNYQSSECSAGDRDCADEYFSASYTEARNKFLEFSQAIETANTYSLAVDEAHGLYTDITILNEYSNSNHMLMHLSGLHGVEGYTGSGIQIYLLQQLAKQAITFDKNENDPPIIVFVHALNPFGFNQSRRANENNVDLNRNFKTQSQWDAFSQTGPNAFHYNDLSDVFNPNLYLTQVSGFVNAYVPPQLQQYVINIYTKLSYISIPLRAIPFAFQHGLKPIKIAANVGQTHMASGWQYIGGHKAEQSHQLLKEFLAQKFAEQVQWKTQINQITMIDVHSGDAMYGIDKLLTDKAEYAQKLKKLLLHYDEKDLIQSLSSDENANDPQFLDGIYDHVNGYSFGYVDYIATLTVHNQQMDLLPFTSEFGCNHRLETIGFTQILENALFQQYQQAVKEENLDSNTKEIMKAIVNKASSWLKDVFYVQEPEWKKIVVRRGSRVFDVCLNR
eukprot:69693_1